MTLLAEYDRRAAHGLHVCGYCRRKIGARSQYLDQRIADSGCVYTFRAHHACHSAYWSWVDPSDGDLYDLADLTEGHLPPCWHAWNRDQWIDNRYVPFIGPRPPCECPS